MDAVEFWNMRGQTGVQDVINEAQRYRGNSHWNEKEKGYCLWPSDHRQPAPDSYVKLTELRKLNESHVIIGKCGGIQNAEDLLKVPCFNATHVTYESGHYYFIFLNIKTLLTPQNDSSDLDVKESELVEITRLRRAVHDVGACKKN